MKKTPEALQKVKLSELTLDLPKDYIEVCCPSCNSTTAAADMNIHDKVAKCQKCNVLFPIYLVINSIEGQKHVHLASFNTHSKAQYLEQEIENHLGIPDRPIPEAS